MREPEIIYEDRHFLAVNKPAGMQVHPARTAGGGRTPGITLTDELTERYPEIRNVGDDPELRPGIVHRLDKETSGVMLVARDQIYFKYLKSLFQKHEIKKNYLCLVFGVFKQKSGTIDAPIGIQNGTTKRSTRSSRMAKEAVTEYHALETFQEEFSLLEVFPKTGRTHQIRVHLASISHPIVGDRLYGPKKQPGWANRLMLHALSLEFTAADGKRLKFEAEPPKELSTMLSSGQ